MYPVYLQPSHELYKTRFVLVNNDRSDILLSPKEIVHAVKNTSKNYKDNCKLLDIVAYINNIWPDLKYTLIGNYIIDPKGWPRFNGAIFVNGNNTLVNIKQYSHAELLKFGYVLFIGEEENKLEIEEKIRLRFKTEIQYA